MMTQNQEISLKQLQDQKSALDQSAIVAMTDVKGKILMVNSRFCEISGYSEAELLGQDHRIINSGFHSKAFFQNLWETIQSGQVWRGEVCNRKKTGEFYWVSTTITPFCDGAGKPYQFMAIRQDITDLKLAQKQIQEQEMRLVTASRLTAIGEMAAAITHEINNPLGVILGRAEMLATLVERGQLEPENLSRLIETIQVTGRRIERIVKSMKTLAYQEKEDEPFQLTAVSEILLDAFELCTQRFINHGIKVDFPQISPQIYIECRSHQIVQVLVNLLNNSYDAVQNQQERWVKVEVLELEDRVQIAVTDSGKGIPLEIQAKLFDPFFSTKRIQFGTGLGLSISKSLISSHQGCLNYDSQSQNTRFIIDLLKKIPQKKQRI